jgi:hypothetical protein
MVILTYKIIIVTVLLNDTCIVSCHYSIYVEAFRKKSWWLLETTDCE